MQELIKIMDGSFNYALDFKSWNEKDFINYVKDFLNGKTEYYMDDYFLENCKEKVVYLLTIID